MYINLIYLVQRNVWYPGKLDIIGKPTFKTEHAQFTLLKYMNTVQYIFRNHCRPICVAMTSS